MGTSFEEKIVEVDDKEKYYIIKQDFYNDNIYLFANLLVDEETPGEEYVILKVYLDADKLKIVKETDEETIEFLQTKFLEAI